MENFEQPEEKTSGDSIVVPVRSYEALNPDSEREILSGFTPEQRREISSKQKILSSLAYFIGKDFNIPVELNEPGKGWHWDFKNNVIRIDPKDLLEKSMEYLRFVISHEGGHRRISRTDFIPLQEWRQPGFSFMMNSVEDPRDNNFVAESYPKFRDQLDLAYSEDLYHESKSKEKAEGELGFQPRFMQAGFEYIKQWFKEMLGQNVEISADLPEDVKAVVKATIESARDSWWRYPSRQEADNGGELEGKKVDGEAMIKEYARTSYEINRDWIWPEFKKLVEEDMKDQKIQELLQDMQKGQEKREESGTGKGGVPNSTGEQKPGEMELPQDLKDKLTPEEQKALEEALNEAIKPIDLDALPEGLKQKLKEYIDSLPEEKRKDMEGKAEAALRDFGKALDDELGEKLSEDPEDTSGRDGESEEKAGEAHEARPGAEKSWQERERETDEAIRERRKMIEAMFETKEKDLYQKTLEKVSDSIDNLTADLRDIFITRKTEKHEAGYRSGRRWNIRQRIREKVAGIPLFKTEAREQRASESEEMDYAITLLVDLSGSMQANHKIEEAFKSAVILAETLNNLGIKFEIAGFQDVLLEFKAFEDVFDEPMRSKLNQMVLEATDSNPDGHNNSGDNDDGACLLEASKHLADQITKNKFLIVLSDGEPAMDSGKKSRSQLDGELKETVAEITSNTNQKLIGIGLMSRAVAKYYENNIAGVSAKEMAETLGGLLREIIERF
jgi:cation transport regulator ChaB